VLGWPPAPSARSLTNRSTSDRDSRPYSPTCPSGHGSSPTRQTVPLTDRDKPIPTCPPGYKIATVPCPIRQSVSSTDPPIHPTYRATSLRGPNPTTRTNRQAQSPPTCPRDPGPIHPIIDMSDEPCLTGLANPIQADKPDQSNSALATLVPTTQPSSPNPSPTTTGHTYRRPVPHRARFAPLPQRLPSLAPIPLQARQSQSPRERATLPSSPTPRSVDESLRAYPQPFPTIQNPTRPTSVLRTPDDPTQPVVAPSPSLPDNPNHPDTGHPDSTLFPTNPSSPAHSPRFYPAFGIVDDLLDLTSYALLDPAQRPGEVPLLGG